jgi:hypothetical protein
MRPGISAMVPGPAKIPANRTMRRAHGTSPRKLGLPRGHRAPSFAPVDSMFGSAVVVVAVRLLACAGSAYLERQTWARGDTLEPGRVWTRCHWIAGVRRAGRDPRVLSPWERMPRGDLQKPRWRVSTRGRLTSDSPTGLVRPSAAYP